MRIKVFSNNTDAKLPTKATEGSVGYDLYAAQAFIIRPLCVHAVGTGLHFEIPNNTEGQIRSRSGIAYKHQVFVINSPGTIDSDFRGEVKVLLYNLSDKDFRVNIGDRIAQIVFAPVLSPSFDLVKSLDETNRGNNGFGSTGLQ